MDRESLHLDDEGVHHWLRNSGTIWIVLETIILFHHHGLDILGIEIEVNSLATWTLRNRFVRGDTTYVFVQ